MTPDVVVDVGNTRIKFGRCDGDRVPVVAGRPHAEPAAAAAVVAEFGLTGRVRWAAAGVQPDRLAAFVAWARQRGDEVAVVDHYRQLPLTVAVGSPDRVGIDRLLGAVAANRRRTGGVPAVVVDAGSAVTVNLVDAGGAFRGGSIAPGLGLMARALNTFTAKLPLVSPETLLTTPPRFPAEVTSTAILCGLRAAAVGGVRELLAGLPADTGRPELFVTGGDGAILAEGLGDFHPRFVPSLTLEGIRIAAEALP